MARSDTSTSSAPPANASARADAKLLESSHGETNSNAPRITL